MQYNYSYEIAAAIIMSLLLFAHLMNPNFELAKSRAFCSFLVAGVLESFLNIISSWGLANPAIVSNNMNKLICFLFFVSEAFVSILFFRYIVNLCESSRKIRTLYAKLTLIPFGFFLILIFSNEFTHLLYQIEDNVYRQGVMAWYGYLYIGIFILASFLVATTAKHTIRGRNRYSVLLASVISLFGIIVQYEVKTVLLTGFSNAIVLCMFYIVIQNPNELKAKASGVRNSQAFSIRFENSINQEAPLNVMLIDIHQPSQLNILYGYRNGNAILTRVGEYLSSLVGVNNTFQLSSNVFAIVLNHLEDKDEMRKKIESRFEQSWNVDSMEIRIPVKTAVIKYPDDVSTTKEFFSLEYFVKQLLRSNTVIKHLDMTDEIKKLHIRNNEVDAALKRALENKSIEVYFQPIYNNVKKKFSSLEALARMIDSELGFVPPDEFISRAESIGVIIPLDFMILDKVCSFIAREILPNNERLEIDSVHINISALQCVQPNMDGDILAIIDKYNVPRSMIVLEVTERAAVTAAELMEKHMHNLKKSGVRFALDDYGTGNSNCSYLIDYPFDEVKFDKGMVWSYFKSEIGKIILEGEMNTIHKLNIPIVAEGIENENQLAAMHEMGVESIQGYYYSKPLAQDDLMDYLFRQDMGTI